MRKVLKHKRIIAVALVLLLTVPGPISNAILGANYLIASAAEQRQWNELINRDLNSELGNDMSGNDTSLDTRGTIRERINRDYFGEIFEPTREYFELEQTTQSFETKRYIITYDEAILSVNKKPGSNSTETASRAIADGIKKDTLTAASLSSALSRDIANVSLKKSNQLMVVEASEEITASDLLSDFQAAGIPVKSIQPDFEMLVSSFDAQGPEELETFTREQKLDMLEPVSAAEANTKITEAQIQTRGNGIKVAVIDTGIETTHAGLAGRISDEYDFFNDDYTANDADWMYDQWHGTFMAGIIAANVSADAAGVAPGASVMALKVFQGGIAYTSDIIEAIEYAEENGARIVNCSFSSSFENPALYEAIAESSMLFVCSAGNRFADLRENPVYPAAFNLPNTISVASVDRDDRLSRFSSYGDVDIAAPGSGIQSLWIENGYSVTRGTSVSSAYVSGLVALILEGDPGLTANELKLRIINAGDIITGLEGKVLEGRRINCEMAVLGMINSTVIDLPDDEFEADVLAATGGDQDSDFVLDSVREVSYGQNMITPRHGLGVVMVGGKVYTIGGQTTQTGGYSNKVEVYNPNTDTWTTETNMPVSRSYFGITAVGTNIYIFGGYNGSAQSSSYVYNTTTKVWSAVASMPRATAFFTADTAYDGSIYMAGGKTLATSASAVNYAYKYTPSTNSWTNLASLPQSQYGHTTTAYISYQYTMHPVNNRLELFGGGIDNVPTRYTYNITSGSWSHGSYASMEQFGAFSSLAYDKYIGMYISGGQTYTNGTTNIEINNISNRIYKGYYRTIRDEMDEGRAGHGSVIIDGRIYVFGGYNNFGVRGSTVIYETGFRAHETNLINTEAYAYGSALNSVSANNKIYSFPKDSSREIQVFNTDTNLWENSITLPLSYTSVNFKVAAFMEKVYLLGGSSGYTVLEFNPMTNTFEYKANMNYEGTSYYIYTYEYNNKLYVFHFVPANAPEINSGRLEVYDPINCAWQILSEVSIPSNMSFMYGYEHQIVAGHGNTNSHRYNILTDTWSTGTVIPALGKWFMDIGGQLYSIQNSDIKRYNVNNGQWFSIDEFSTYYAAYMGDTNEKIYLTNFQDNVIIEYTPPRNPWDSADSVSRVGHQSAVIGEDFYLFGGKYSKVASADNKVFKMETGNSYFAESAWKEKAPMAKVRSYFASAVLGGKIYAIAGTDFYSGDDTMQMYDPATNTWTTKAALPICLHRHAAAEANGKIYVFGGYSTSLNAISNRTYEYNPSSNTWTLKGNMPVSRYDLQAVTVNNKIYLIGGRGTCASAPGDMLPENDGPALADVYEYNPSTNTYTKKADLPIGLAGFGSATDGISVFAVGGYDAAGWHRNEVFEYSPATDTWTVRANIKVSRAKHTCEIKNDVLYVFGGDVDRVGGSAPMEVVDLNLLTNEYLHFGREEVSLSGNFARTYTDLSMDTPGFTLNLSRTYNSQDEREDTYMGKGWSFGFSASIKNTYHNVYTVRLPDGSAHLFKLENNAFVAQDTRSTLVKQPDNSYILTAKDQYKYGFSSHGYMTYMEDPNGNRITITVDSNGKITAIMDQTNRTFTVSYNGSNLISQITDPIGRTVVYTYSNGQLSSVTRPDGTSTNYIYSGGLLSTVNISGSSQNAVVEQVTYNTSNPDKPRVATLLDKDGVINTFSYNDSEGIVTETKPGGRVTTTWYDLWEYPVRICDAENREKFFEYFYSRGANLYGELRRESDWTGNNTYYERDNNGNITRIINPDMSTREYTYDSLNRVLTEKNETGRTTWYVYSGANLERMAVRLSGNEPYTVQGNQTNFAVTSYTYHGSVNGIGGLVAAVTDPLGNVTAYTYDSYGYTATVTAPDNGITTRTYNTVGYMTSQKDHYNNTTSYYYDRMGRVVKTVYPNGGAERMVYDYRGNLVKKVGALQYSAPGDSASFSGHSILSNVGAYAPDSGERYTYDPQSRLLTKTDPLDNATTFTYDAYGNIAAETNADGAIYSYSYDKLNRLTRKAVKESSVAAEEVLVTYAYAAEAGSEVVTTTEYFDSNDTAVTTEEYDFAGRQTKVTMPDGGVYQTVYNADGTINHTINPGNAVVHYVYDMAGRNVRKYTQLNSGSYRLTEWVYDKTGRVTRETAYTEAIVLNGNGSNGYYTDYTYDACGRLASKTDSEDRGTTYIYDLAGRLTEESARTTSAFALRTTNYTYNSMGKVVSETRYAEARDIYGYGTGANLQSLVTAYTYDVNGNMLTKSTPDNVTTTYTYDVMGRVITVSMPAADEDGTNTTATVSTTYDFAGNILTTANALNQTSSYQYDSLGRLTQSANAEGGVEARYYDRLGRLTAVVSAEHFSLGLALFQMTRTEYVYDAAGRVCEVREVYRQPSGTFRTIVTEERTYDLCGNLTQVKDGLEETTEYTYNLSGTLAAVTDKLGAVTSYAYDALDRLTQETDPRGGVTEYEYDSAGNVVEVRRNNTIVSESTYDLEGRQLTATDAKGAVTSCQYNLFGKVRSVTLPGDSTVPALTTSYKYNELGIIKETSDTGGLTLTYTLDPQGRVRSETAAGAGINYTVYNGYDLAGNLVKSTDALGNVTLYTYDGLGRNTGMNSGGKQSAVSYDLNGNKLSETDWLGNVTSYGYDNLNRMVSVTDATGTVIETLTYNDRHEQVSSADALNNTTAFVYDGAGRLVSTTDPSGNVVSQTYDFAGNVISETDGEGNMTEYTYDLNNRLICVSDAAGNDTSYTYDNAGNMLTMTDGNGETTSYTYNIRSLVVSRTDGDNGVETYSYDAKGNVTQKTDRVGVATATVYDPLGRLVTSDAGGDIVTYTYDAAGNELTMTDSAGVTTRTYDRWGRVLTKTVPGMGTTSFTYDLVAGLTSGYVAEQSAYPDGSSVTKAYDKCGRLIEVIDGSETSTYTYYANGNLQQVSYPYNISESYTYYANGKLHTLVNKQGQTILDGYNYAYDGAGNILVKADGTGDTYYTYTALGQLATVTEPGGRVTVYTYDAAGNRLSETVTGSNDSYTASYIYTPSNRLVTMTKIGTKNGQSIHKVTNYHYDPNGNMVSRQTDSFEASGGDGQVSIHEDLSSDDPDPDPSEEDGIYGYDARNRLVSVTQGDTNISYTYNGAGQRVSKTTDEESYTYLYEYDKIVLEKDSSNSYARNLYGSTLISRVVDNAKAYYLYNGHGDVVKLVTSGQVVASYEYDAFGNILEESGSFANPYRYSGYYYEAATGLYDLKARFYDADIARFMQEDTYLGRPSDPLSLNLYSYVLNNPLRYWDPTGHWEAGDSALPLGVQREILTLTDAWYAAKTQSERDWLHSQAEALRSQKYTSNDYSYANQDTASVNDLKKITNQLDSIIASDKYITTDKYWDVIDNSGSNAYTTSYADVNFAQNGLVHTITTTSFGRTYVAVSTSYSYKYNYTESVNLSVYYQTYNETEDKNINQWIIMGFTMEEAMILLDYMNNQREYDKYGYRSESKLPSISAKALARLLPNANIADYEFASEMIERSYNWAGFGYTMAESNYLMGDMHNSQVQAIVGYMAFTTQQGYQINLRTPGRLTNPQTPSEWMEMNGTTVARLNGGQTAVSTGSNTYYRYMSEAEYKVITGTGDGAGYLRGGRAGDTFFTNSNYTSAATAQSELSLEFTPERMVEFKIINNPNVSGGGIVAPKFGQPGGGIEFFTSDPVQVQIINSQPLR
jgi:RHS repeat-associated protein